MDAVCVDDPVEEEAQKRAEPDDAGDDWEDLGRMVRNGGCFEICVVFDLPSMIRSL